MKEKIKKQHNQDSMWDGINDVTSEVSWDDEEQWDDDFSYEGGSCVQANAIKAPREKFHFTKKVKRNIIITGASCIVCACAVLFIVKITSFDHRYLQEIASASQSVLSLSTNYSSDTTRCIEADKARNFIKKLKLKPSEAINEQSYNGIRFDFNWSKSKSISFFSTPNFTTVKLMDDLTPKYYRTEENIFNQAETIYNDSKNFFTSFYNTTIQPLIQYNQENKYALEGSSFNTIHMVDFCLRNSSNLQSLLPQGTALPMDDSAIVEVSFEAIQPLVEKYFGQSLTDWKGPTQIWDVAADVQGQKIQVRKSHLSMNSYVDPNLTDISPEYTVRANGDIEATINWDAGNTYHGQNVTREKYLMQKNENGEYSLKQLTCQRREQPTNENENVPVTPVSTASFMSDKLPYWRDGGVLYRDWHLFLECASITEAKIIGLNITTSEVVEGGLVEYSSEGGKFTVKDGQLFYQTEATIYRIDEGLQIQQTVEIPEQIRPDRGATLQGAVLYDFTSDLNKILYRPMASQNQLYIYTPQDGKSTQIFELKDDADSWISGQFATADGKLWVWQHNREKEEISLYNTQGKEEITVSANDISLLNGAFAFIHINQVKPMYDTLQPVMEQPVLRYINAHTGEQNTTPLHINSMTDYIVPYANEAVCEQGFVYVKTYSSTSESLVLVNLSSGEVETEVIRNFSGSGYYTSFGSTSGLLFTEDGRAVLVKTEGHNIEHTVCG